MVIDPVAMFLAELAPVLRRHMRWTGAEAPFGYWPLDLPHLLQAFGTWYLQRQLFGHLPKNLPDPDLHATLHAFCEERLTTEDYWRSLIYTPWPSAFRPTDEAELCGERGPRMIAVNTLLSSPDADGGATSYSPQSPPASSISDLQDWLCAGYSPKYTPNSPTYTPAEDHVLTDGEADHIDRVLHELRTRGDVSQTTPEVIEIVPDEQGEFDSHYNDE